MIRGRVSGLDRAHAAVTSLKFHRLDVPHLPGPQYAESLARNASRLQRIGECKGRRIDRFVGELEGAVMAGECGLGTAIEQSLHRLRGIHVLVAHEPARLVGPDRQDRELEWAVTIAYPPEIDAVAI